MYSQHNESKVHPEPDKELDKQDNILYVSELPQSFTQIHTNQVYQNRYNQQSFGQGIPLGLPFQGYGIQQFAQVQIPSNANYMEFPTKIICPKCYQITTTRVNCESGGFTFINCAAIALFCLIFCCIPFCQDDCKDKSHYCQHCNTLVGIHQYKSCS